MKRVVLGVACLLACNLSTGCAHTGNSSSNYFTKFLTFIHLRSEPIETKSQENHQVCILDPTLLAEKEAPVQAEKASEKPPVAEVPETSYDFGKITEERDFVHQFSVRNTGKSVLTIKKVVPG